jgi:hypothetical protein
VAGAGAGAGFVATAGAGFGAALAFALAWCFAFGFGFAAVVVVVWVDVVGVVAGVFACLPEDEPQPAAISTTTSAAPAIAKRARRSFLVICIPFGVPHRSAVRIR